VNGITIYVEGGGDQSGTKSRFRKGMDAFLSELKSAARAKSWHWKLVPGGGRQRTYDAFCNACRNEDNTVIVLLFDSEGPVPRHITSIGFLRDRDRWELPGISEEVVHLMVQTMETWIISDLDALSRYYGRNFRHRVLPSVQENLENISKRDIEKSLTRATNSTRKGTYHKIKHGTALLEEIDSGRVRNRCSSCRRFFEDLGRIIELH
jgi:hypothetical protein